MVASTMRGVPVRRTKLLREGVVVAPLGQPRQQDKRSAAETRFEKLWMRHFRPAVRRTVHELLVTHGNLIRCLVAVALDDRAPSTWTRIRTYNCSLTTFIVDREGRVEVSTVNNVGYLPHALVTQSPEEGSVYVPSD
jgi:broad specificity phosphatase PhoE